ncbi:MAG: putative ABC transporter permease [Clostridia bacterium]|nr:putative ABC transporter permease [Clostridia bacterium]MDD4386515.1 putative ABC transporter permease [Clostridia bacterium]
MDTSINVEQNNKKKSFAEGLNFFKLFWIFYIGCFAGVVIETIWCIVKNGVLESRTALVILPLNPVYGFGVLIISICFVRFSGNKNITIFLGCMVVGGMFEYLCSLFQEMVFGTISWSYASDSLGIFERTSLIYCVFWGILGVMWVRGIYPYLSNIIQKIPNDIGKFLTYFLLIIIIIDIIFTSLALFRQLQRREGTPATNLVQEFYDKNLDDATLKKIYPNMTPVR